MEAIELVKNFGIPVLGAVGGWLWSAANYKHRLEQIEKDLRTYKDDQEKQKEKEGAQKEKEEKSVLALIEKVSSQLKDEHKALDAKIEEIDKAFTRFERGSSHDFAQNEEFVRFVEEQQRSWQAMNRTLGQIEGYLKRSPRSEFPPQLKNSR